MPCPLNQRFHQQLESHTTGAGGYSTTQGTTASGQEDHLPQLPNQYSKLLEALEDEANDDLIYTNFTKAFEEYSHGVIVHEIREVRKLMKWEEDFII